MMFAMFAFGQEELWANNCRKDVPVHKHVNRGSS